MAQAVARRGRRLSRVVVARCTVPGTRGNPLVVLFFLFVLAWACAMGVGHLPNSCTPLNACQDITAYHRVRILFYLLGCMLKLLGISAFRVAFVYFDISP